MSRIKKKEIKYHKIQLELIKEFKTSKLGKLISKKESFNGKNAKFSPHKKEFTINFQNDIFSKSRKNLSVGEYHKGIQIQFGKTIYNLENVFLGKYTSSEITGSIDRIHTDGFSEKHRCYYQLIIPLEKKLDFHYNIMETPFISDLGYYSRKGTTAIINGESISVCCIHDDKNKYFLAIDSSAKQTFDEFAKKTHAITIGIGYMSGYYAGNQGFYFTYTRRDKKEPKLFRCIALRDSIKSSYSPVYSNAYSYLGSVI